MSAYFNPYEKYDDETTQTTENEKNKVIEIELNMLIPFKKQPFNEYSENEMNELKESIMRIGLQNAIIARKTDNEKYEILSGHNRVSAFKQLGYKTIPCKIVDVDDDTAEMILIDTNIVQRFNLSVMERAKAYKRKDEIKKRKKYNIDKVSENLSDEEKAILNSTEAKQTYYRYLSLNNLIPEFQKQCENGKISVTSGEHLSKLDERQQMRVLNLLDNITLTEQKANAIKKLFQSNNDCSDEEIKALFIAKKKDNKTVVRFTKNEANTFFKQFDTNEQVKQYIIKLINSDMKIENI